MVVVEPVVNEEKVRQLLAEQAESEFLDYKEVVDLRVKADEVELAKDLGAMQVLGGYVVIGADSRGRLTGRLTAGQAQQFDEANVRQKIAKYVSEPIDLLAAHHTIDGQPVAVVYTAQHRDCLAIFKSDGQYRDARSRDQIVFRKGEVFARHGSRSERWRQEDVERIRRCLVAGEKETWRREIAEELARLSTGTRAQQIAMGPADSLTWRVDAATFRATAIELVRANDPIPLRLLLHRLPVDGRTLLTDADEKPEFDTLLNRTASLAALGLELGQTWLFAESVDALRRFYLLGHGDRVGAQLATTGAQVWLSVILRVYGLGAYSVRREEWSAVAALALQRPEPADNRRQYYRSWIRHALTMAARSNLLAGEQEGRRIELSLLSMAHDVVRDEPNMRPDVAEGDEAVLNSLCQFDALASLAAMADAGTTDTSVFYTSFARFYSYRTEPIIARLTTDSALRAAIFPQDDSSLADALRQLDRMASSESFRYAGWDGYTDPAIAQFLGANPPSNQ